MPRADVTSENQGWVAGDEFEFWDKTVGAGKRTSDSKSKRAWEIVPEDQMSLLIKRPTSALG